jgi:hypothetical protein
MKDGRRERMVAGLNELMAGKWVGVTINKTGGLTGLVMENSSTVC